MGDLLFESGQKVLLIGDSITDCGRRGDQAPLGAGYVSKVVDLITARYPDRQITWENRGIGGDVVEGLEARWDADVIQEQPDWLSVAIGINNISRQCSSGTALDEYLPKWEATYRRILQQAREKTPARFIMLEVFYIEEDVAAPHDWPIDEYNAVIHKLAEEFDAILVRVNAAYDRAVAARPGFSWTSGDGVHPLAVGHALMALTFLDAVGW